jgi:hypothetical protein
MEKLAHRITSMYEIDFRKDLEIRGRSHGIKPLKLSIRYYCHPKVIFSKFVADVIFCLLILKG